MKIVQKMPFQDCKTIVELKPVVERTF